MFRRASLKEFCIGIDLLQIPLEPLVSSRAFLQNGSILPTRAFSGSTQHKERKTLPSNSENTAPFPIFLMNKMIEPYTRVWSNRYTRGQLVANKCDCCSRHEVLNGEWTSKAQCVDKLNQRYSLQNSGSSKVSRNWITNAVPRTATNFPHIRWYTSDAAKKVSDKFNSPEVQDHSQRAVVMALCCNFLVFCLKCGVWVMTASHVMLAEAVHSLADLANQALLAYGLVSSRRAPDEIHPYGYSKERFVWSLISAVGIFCLGSGATIVDGVSSLWRAELPDNMSIAAAVLACSMIIEGASLLVAISAVRKGASAEGMTLWDYCWRGHDPTAVAVMMEDGAAVTGLVIAGVSLVAVFLTGNPIYDPIGSILVGNLLGIVAVFLIQRNRHALLGRAMDNQDMKLVLDFLSSDPVVDAVFDCKSEVIGPRAYRFKAEIDFNGVVIVQNYLKGVNRETWANQFRDALNDPDGRALDRVMSDYGEEVVTALGSEVDRLEREIQRLVPGIRHVDIETHNPNGPFPF
ncbi:hypothetical protein GOP47_0015409 [Adiantum capillus-veneris]|uniref:Cation efflux protein transmembrane domain-containing protein n=1 Tax=Adiantum capillus-veneris TaxID=13818 RepID=A0A9D4UKL3_ADICA|nr:hypothetical protein GOP47_0015409 [Adiantum capillus-veneris]